MTDTPPQAGSTPSRTPWRVFVPMIGVAIVLCIYSVYWYVVAGKTRTAIEDFAADVNPGDIAVGWSGLSITGFPYRIAANFTAPEATAPRTPEAWAWQADSLEADFLPYDLRHVVLKIGGEQVLRYSDVSGPKPKRHVIRATAAGTWASYVAVPGTSFGRLAIDIDDLVAMREGAVGGHGRRSGERFAAGRLQLHMRPSEEAAGGVAAPVPAVGVESYDLALQGNDMAIDRADAFPVLGSQVSLFSAQARLRNVPKGKRASAVELSRDWLQHGGSLAVSDLQIKWGPLDMWAQGELTLDDKARLQGSFDAEINDYRGLLAALVKAHVISERDQRLALMGLGLVAQLQGSSEARVRVPIVMNEGRLYLGPLVVAKLEPIY